MFCLLSLTATGCGSDKNNVTTATKTTEITTESTTTASTDEYVGPYPPVGTHCYDIYVFVLKEPVEKAKGTLNQPNFLFYKNAMKLDLIEEGSSGNIISYGYLPETYTRNQLSSDNIFYMK